MIIASILYQSIGQIFLSRLIRYRKSKIEKSVFILLPTLALIVSGIIAFLLWLFLKHQSSYLLYTALFLLPMVGTTVLHAQKRFIIPEIMIFISAIIYLVPVYLQLNIDIILQIFMLKNFFWIGLILFLDKSNMRGHVYCLRLYFKAFRSISLLAIPKSQGIFDRFLLNSIGVGYLTAFNYASQISAVLIQIINKLVVSIAVVQDLSSNNKTPKKLTGIICFTLIILCVIEVIFLNEALTSFIIGEINGFPKIHFLILTLGMSNLLNLLKEYNFTLIFRYSFLTPATIEVVCFIAGCFLKLIASVYYGIIGFILIYFADYLARYFWSNKRVMP